MILRKLLMLTAACLASTPLLAGEALVLPADLQTELAREYGAEIRYLAAHADLDDDGIDETIVHLVSPMVCGTGGCSTLVFTPGENADRQVADISVSRPPIGLSSHRSNGWRNLVVHVAGGGMPSTDAELLFDGESYPHNPSVPGPGVRQADIADVTILIEPFETLQDATPLSPAVLIQGGFLEAPDAMAYRCKGREGTPFFAVFYDQTEPASVVLTLGDAQVIAPKLTTASGVRYVSDDVDFRLQDGQATVTWSGETFTCEVQ